MRMLQERDEDPDFMLAREALGRQKASLEAEQAARFKLPGQMQDAILKVLLCRFICLTKIVQFLLIQLIPVNELSLTCRCSSNSWTALNRCNLWF